MKAGLKVANSLAILAVLGEVAQVAQAQSSTQNPVIEEVIITAQRRESTLQDTAAAVSAYSSADMASRGMEDIESLGRMTPSMDISIYQGEAQVYIRGIGYSGIIGGTDSSTALHLDGVYISRSSGAVPGFMDVERVEVVRGPQGTLYGRNATSGSVNIIHKAPTEELSGEASLELGNYDSYKVMGAISGPISDHVSARLAVQSADHDGYTTLLTPDGDPLGIGSSRHEAEGVDDIAARLTLDYRPTDKLLFRLAGDYYEADDTRSIWTYLNRGTATNPFFRQYVQERGGELPKTYSRRWESDLPHMNKPRIWGLTGRIEYEFSNYSLTSITAYRETNPKNRNDLDTTGAFGVDQYREEDHSQFSQEFQLSSLGEDSLDWIIGAYYFEEDNDVRNEYLLPFIDEQFGLPSDPDCCLLKLNGDTDTQSYAFFGELTWHFSERMSLLLGGRYSSETRGGANAVVMENFPTDILNNVAPFRDKEFDDFTPKVGLNFSYSDDMFFYASISEGFKSGGYNVGSYQNTPFDPEQLIAYELGAKTEFLDNRLRLNSALFFYDYTDLQIQDVENNNTVVRNAADAEILGLELEGVALLGVGLQVDFGFTWLDAEFRNVALIDPKFPDLGLQDLDGNRLPRAPEFKTVLGVQYGFDLGSAGELTLRADWSWQDDVYFSAFNVSELEEESYQWLRARISYTSSSAHWSAAAYIDNITDEEVATNATFNGDIIDSTVTGNMAPPRTYGVEVRYEF